MRTRALVRSLCGLCALSSVASAQQAPPAPPDSPEARKVVALVEDAATLVSKQGKPVFTEFRKKGSKWFTGNTYLFVYDMEANELFNAAFPEREGHNRADAKDANGKPMVAEFIKLAGSKGSGWVDYMFPKPGQTQPSRKWAYVKRVKIDGVPALIAAGFYPE